MKFLYFKNGTWAEMLATKFLDMLGQNINMIFVTDQESSRYKNERGTLVISVLVYFTLVQILFTMQCLLSGPQNYDGLLLRKQGHPREWM